MESKLREQQLMDCCFKLVTTAVTKSCFRHKSIKQLNEWVKDQLKQSGFHYEKEGT